MPQLEPIVAPPERVRRLSYSALALFERCAYRFYAERLAGLRPVDGSAQEAVSGGINPVPDAVSVGLAASEIGDAVHKLLERVDLASPAAPSLDEVLTWYPAATGDELGRIGGLVEAFRLELSFGSAFRS